MCSFPPLTGTTTKITTIPMASKPNVIVVQKTTGKGATIQGLPGKNVVTTLLNAGVSRASPGTFLLSRKPQSDLFNITVVFRVKRAFRLCKAPNQPSSPHPDQSPRWSWPSPKAWPQGHRLLPPRSSRPRLSTANKERRRWGDKRREEEHCCIFHINLLLLIMWQLITCTFIQACDWHQGTTSVCTSQEPWIVTCYFWWQNGKWGGKRVFLSTKLKLLCLRLLKKSAKNYASHYVKCDCERKS